jgi:glycosyltransferase involved in cell wall biosynthesis
MTSAVGIVYVTGRADPAFDWFADGLAAQLGDGDDVELVVVDALRSPARTRLFGASVRGRFRWRHVAPKPTPWQGPHRRTREDWFGASSARNTGLVACRAPYIVFVDDCSVPLPGWWKRVKRAAAAGDVVTGAYRKAWSMRVEAGRLVEARVEASGIDSRWPLGHDRRPVPVEGGQLFGASIGAPRERLVSLNGFDELCDSIGGEDWQLGLRLVHAGATILYDRSMQTVESEERHRVGRPLRREDPELDRGDYMARLREFGVTRRVVERRHDSSSMVLDIVLGTRSPGTHGNYYWLPALAPRDLAATVGRFPRARWFDGRSLESL